MDFYSDLSQYFEDIFPLGAEKLTLIEKYLKKGSSILDIGCSTGELVIALAKEGYNPEGMDLNPEMIEKAKRLAHQEGVELEFKVGDMSKLTDLYNHPFNGMLCFGNTIVHLTTSDMIKHYFQQVYDLLTQQGAFIFQIVNYDRVLIKEIKELPLIENKEKGLKFYRHYDYDLDTNLIDFKTRLVLENGEEKEHSVPLYALQKNEIEEMLTNVGFTQLEFFGNFKQGNFDAENSMPLVAVARKQ